MTLEWSDCLLRTHGVVGLHVDGRWAGYAYTDGSWCTAGTRLLGGHSGRADPPTLEAAQAALVADVWAQAAEGLVRR